VLKVGANEDGLGGDEAADCLRYLVGTKSRKTEGAGINDQAHLPPPESAGGAHDALSICRQPWCGGRELNHAARSNLLGEELRRSPLGWSGRAPDWGISTLPALQHDPNRTVLLERL